MQIRATLRPGQRGTRSLLEQYAGRLVCVRYRELRARIKRAGARWNPELGVWSLQLGLARQLGLTKRIVPKVSRSGSQAGN